MPDILSNSIKKQTNQTMPTKIDAAVKLVEKKQDIGFMTKMAKAFVAVDPGTVCKTVVDQVVIPTVKRTMITAITSGLSMMFNINVTPQTIDSVFGTQTTASRIGYTSYGSLNAQTTALVSSVQVPPPTALSGMKNYALFTYNSEADALTTIERMAELADVYDRSIAVGYLCQLVGQPDVPTDYNFGWSKENIARAKPVMNIDGTWSISWPKPVAINI